MNLIMFFLKLSIVSHYPKDEAQTHKLAYKIFFRNHSFLTVLGLHRVQVFLQLQRAEATLQLQRVCFSSRRLLLLYTMGYRVHRVQQSWHEAQQLWLPDSRAQAQQLWYVMLVAPWHLGSSQLRDQNHVSCIGRQILTIEPPGKLYFYKIPDQYAQTFQSLKKSEHVLEPRGTSLREHD